MSLAALLCLIVRLLSIEMARCIDQSLYKINYRDLSALRFIEVGVRFVRRGIGSVVG